MSVATAARQDLSFVRAQQAETRLFGHSGAGRATAAGHPLSAHPSDRAESEQATPSNEQRPGHVEVDSRCLSSPTAWLRTAARATAEGRAPPLTAWPLACVCVWPRWPAGGWVWARTCLGTRSSAGAIVQGLGVSHTLGMQGSGAGYWPVLRRHRGHCPCSQEWMALLALQALQESLQGRAPGDPLYPRLPQIFIACQDIAKWDSTGAIAGFGSNGGKSRINHLWSRRIQPLVTARCCTSIGSRGCIPGVKALQRMEWSADDKGLQDLSAWRWGLWIVAWWAVGGVGDRSVRVVC
jgi:hypothetical protein